MIADISSDRLRVIASCQNAFAIEEYEQVQKLWQKKY